MTDLTSVQHDSEIAVVKKLQNGHACENCGLHNEPHRIAFYLYELHICTVCGTKETKFPVALQEDDKATSSAKIALLRLFVLLFPQVLVFW